MADPLHNHPEHSLESEITKSMGKDTKVINEGSLEKVNYSDSRRMSASYVFDPAAERKLVWKFDLRILPVLAVMYLFNSLDKSNLGNPG